MPQPGGDENQDPHQAVNPQHQLRTQQPQQERTSAPKKQDNKRNPKRPTGGAPGIHTPYNVLEILKTIALLQEPHPNMSVLLPGDDGSDSDSATEPAIQPAGRSKRKASSGVGDAVAAAKAKHGRGRAHGQPALAGQNESGPRAPLVPCIRASNKPPPQPTQSEGFSNAAHALLGLRGTAMED